MSVSHAANTTQYHPKWRKIPFTRHGIPLLYLWIWWIKTQLDKTDEFKAFTDEISEQNEGSNNILRGPKI